MLHVYPQPTDFIFRTVVIDKCTIKYVSYLRPWYYCYLAVFHIADYVRVNFLR